MMYNSVIPSSKDSGEGGGKSSSGGGVKGSMSLFDIGSRLEKGQGV